MVTAIQSLTVILISVLLSAKIGVNGSKPPCRPNAIVNLTGEELDSSGSVHKSGFVFPPESMWTESDTGLFGCPCYFQRCQPECCPIGHAMNLFGCVEDVYTAFLLYKSKNDRESYVFLDNRCIYMTDISVREDFIRLKTGQLLLKSSATIVELGEYCVFRKENSPNFWAVICTENNSEEPMTIPISVALSSLNISMLFALATFIIYSLIPELKNLQGSILRSYLASYIICIICITVFLSTFVYKLTHLYLVISIAVIYYFGVACLMWLNVMSLDIWRKFRKIRSSSVVNIKQRQRATFIRYSVFVWVGSAVPPLISCVYTVSIPGVLWTGCLWWYLMLWPLAVIPFCNMCLLAATMLNIHEFHQENNQRFNLYVKLFLIMGFPAIFWAIAFFRMNPQFFDFVCILEALQGISIFYIFIWKDDVKYLLRKRFNVMLLRVSVFFRRRYISPVIIV